MRGVEERAAAAASSVTGAMGWVGEERAAAAASKSPCSAYGLGAASCVAPSAEALHCWVWAQGLPRWTGVQRPRARRCTIGCGAVVAGATQKG